MAKCAFCGKAQLAADRDAGQCQRCHHRHGTQPPSTRYVRADAKAALLRGDPVPPINGISMDCLDCRRGNHDICIKYERIFCDCARSEHKVKANFIVDEDGEEWEVF